MRIEAGDGKARRQESKTASQAGEGLPFTIAKKEAKWNGGCR